MQTTLSNVNELRDLALNAIRELESPDGILASGRSEAYGCVFGRDSLITSLELLRAYTHGAPESRNPYFLELVGKILRSLASLQGRHTNIESGEEPGKIIHEYRPDKHEHLTKLLEDPWFIYPEGVMRNYDSVDSTILFLIAVHEYMRARQKVPRSGEINETPARDTFVGHDPELEQLMPSVRAALAWVKKFDGFVSYQFHPDRKYGGLKVQSWMDSTESLFFEQSDVRPAYPIAPVEVQAYAWSALTRWGEHDAAAMLKAKFNKEFVLRGPKSVTLAYAIDGNGTKLSAARSSMGHVLWAAYGGECILDSGLVDGLRKRLLSRDLFVPKAGIRTLSNRSLRYDPMSYHNGSIWPHDTAMLADGLENFGYHADAKQVRKALMNAYLHFKTPIELFSYNRGIKEYKRPHDGHGACRVQAWSAAALVSIAREEAL
jgi:glycogen debranching enzyme